MELLHGILLKNLKCVLQTLGTINVFKEKKWHDKTNVGYESPETKSIMYPRQEKKCLNDYTH